MNNEVVIVVPVYLHKHTNLEMLAITNNLKVLQKYFIVFVAPEGFDTTELSQFASENVVFEYFDKHYFESIKGYNNLLMSVEFFERFSSYKYMLICQPDVFVFRDELMQWIQKDYDYIGAPWVGPDSAFWTPIVGRINNLVRPLIGKKPKNWRYLYKVGNGGFSLRKIASHLKITTNNRADIDMFLTNSSRGAEDIFWSLYVPQIDEKFSIPDYKEAVGFSIDQRPKEALKLNKGKLPFACHGITRPKLTSFWTPIIKKHLNQM